MKAEFVKSAVHPDQFPEDGLPEIAFLGRSNVGKSSLLNCLVGSSGLAFTSSKPGCTQVINFFRVDGGFTFVDLPGYGYARVPLEIKAQWKRLVEQYLLHREALATCFLILDARRGWMEKDLELKNWLEVHGRRYLVIATKSDKLKTQKERAHSMAAIRGRTDTDPLPFSAIQCQGAREIWQAIRTIKKNDQ